MDKQKPDLFNSITYLLYNIITEKDMWGGHKKGGQMPGEIFIAHLL